jgi:hypothetical protein
MRTNRLSLIISVPLALGGLALVAAFVVQAQNPNWNLREPRIMSLSFPSPEEVAAKAVAATSEERAECMTWIAEFLKPSAVPEGWDKHLLAVRDVIPSRPVTSRMSPAPPDAPRTVPGFVVRYETQGYVFQIMETRSLVSVGILDLGPEPARTSETDRTSFVRAVIEQFVNPQPVDPFIIAPRSDPAAALYGVYLPVKRSGGSKGYYVLDREQMKRSAFVDVHFATDGKAVILEAYKNLPFPSDHMKPRFSALTPPVPPTP